MLYGLTSMLLFAKRGLRPLWISNVTQVPAIIGKVAESFLTAYPNPFNPSRRSFDHLCVAREIMRKHRAVFGVGDEAGFDEERFIITNAYTGGSDNLKKKSGCAQTPRRARQRAVRDGSSTTARGDDFLQIARFDQPAALRYLLRERAAPFAARLLYRLLFLLLGRIVHAAAALADAAAVRWASCARDPASFLHVFIRRIHDPQLGFVTRGGAGIAAAPHACWSCGAGGMGGAACSRWRGPAIGSFAMADIDTFEVSNINRQVFADLDTVDQHKAEATANGSSDINPGDRAGGRSAPTG